MNNGNVAYDLSLFEEKKKKRRAKNNIAKIPRKKFKRVRRINPAAALYTSIVSIVIVSVLSFMIYSQIQLNELTDKINTTSKELAESQSVYTQLKMKAESEVSLKAVEEFARNELFMFEVGPSQYNYISLSNGKDKSEIKNIANDSIFDKIKKCFK